MLDSTIRKHTQETQYDMHSPTNNLKLRQPNYRFYAEISLLFSSYKIYKFNRLTNDKCIINLQTNIFGQI